MAAFNNTLISPWGARTNPQYATAVATELAKAPGQFGQNLANMYGSYNQGYGSYNQALQGLGDSYAKNYAAMASGISGLANSLGNTWNNAQANSASASAAEAARQAAVSNLGTAAMTSYGNVAGQGLQAWSQNQNGYQRALSDLGSSNQSAISSLGGSRYNALANLGKSGSAMQVGRDVSAALPGVMGAVGNTFSAPNYREPTSSGVVSGGSSSGSSFGGAGYDMLSGLRSDINDGRELGALSRGYGASMGSLNSDQARARNMPRTMVNDARNSLMDFNRMNLDASSQGMNQFYSAYRDTLAGTNRPGQEIPTGSLLDALAGGYTDSAKRIGTVQKDVNTGFSDNKGIYNKSVAGVNDLFNRSIGNMGVFNNQLQNQQMEYALKDAATARKKREQEQTRASILARFGSPAAYARALNGYNY